MFVIVDATAFVVAEPVVVTNVVVAVTNVVVDATAVAGF